MVFLVNGYWLMEKKSIVNGKWQLPVFFIFYFLFFIFYLFICTKIAKNQY